MLPCNGAQHRQVAGRKVVHLGAREGEGRGGGGGRQGHLGTGGGRGGEGAGGGRVIWAQGGGGERRGRGEAGSSGHRGGEGRGGEGRGQGEAGSSGHRGGGCTTVHGAMQWGGGQGISASGIGVVRLGDWGVVLRGSDLYLYRM